VSFTVKDASWFAAQRTRVNRWIDDNQMLIGIALAAGAIFLLYMKRHLIPFEVRRK